MARTTERVTLSETLTILEQLYEPYEICVSCKYRDFILTSFAANRRPSLLDAIAQNIVTDVAYSDGYDNITKVEVIVSLTA